MGLPIDWSHTHVLYTNHGSAQRVASAQRDPRAWHNWMARTFHPRRAVAASAPPTGTLPVPAVPTARWNPRRNKASHVDWAVSLGPNGGVPVGETPAKYVFDFNQPPSCQNDFVVFVINATPTAGGQANIVALNNLYSGSTPTAGICGSGSATFMWSYAAGSGPILRSPSLSLDGKKVAFVEAASSGRAVFHILTWVAGQGSDATHAALPGSGGSSDVTVDYTNLTNSGCTASPAGVGNASPYIDYVGDVAYLGDANGRLYRIKGVFNGAPTLDYCVSVSPGKSLSSAVYDYDSNQVFVADGRSVFAYSVGSGCFTRVGSITVAGTDNSIVLSPILDASSGFLYVFSSHDNSNTHSIVSQMPLSLASHTDVDIGPASSSFSVFDGAFDNNYYDLGPASGTLYACGTQPTNANKPALYTLSFQADGTLSTTPVMSGDINLNDAANSIGSCSPLTEFYDGANDRLFVGTGNYTSTTGANQVTMWNINSPLTSASTTANATAINEIGGASGIAVDNNSSEAQASSIYFGTLQKSGTSPCGANLYCAVKLTQGALQ